MLKAGIDASSVRQAVRDLKTQIVAAQRNPVPVRLQFRIGQPVADQLSSELVRKMGPLEVSVVAADHAKADLLATLGPVVVKVKLVADGPVQGTDGGRGGRGGGGGVRPTGGDGGAPHIGGFAGLPIRVQRDGPTGSQVRQAAEATIKQGQEAPTASRPVTPATAPQASVAATAAAKSQPATTRANATVPGRPEAGNLAEANRVQASERVNRGIYPASETAIVAARKAAEENLGLTRGITPSTRSKFFQRYKAAGGDVPSLVNIGVAKPLPGHEAEYLKEFGKEAIERRRMTRPFASMREHGIDAKSASMAGFGATHDPAALAANVELYEQATEDLKQSYKDTEEFGNIKGHYAQVFRSTPEGKLEPVLDVHGKPVVHPAYEGRAGRLIELLRDELQEALAITDPQQRIEALGEVARGAFAIGGVQRTGMEKLATARGHPGRGKRRFRALIGQRVKNVRNINEQAILDVRSMALAALEEAGRTQSVIAGEEPPESQGEFIAAAREKILNKPANKIAPPEAEVPKRGAALALGSVSATPHVETQEDRVARLQKDIKNVQERITAKETEAKTYTGAKQIVPATIVQDLAKRRKQLQNLQDMLDRTLSGKAAAPGAPVATTVPVTPAGPKLFSGGPYRPPEPVKGRRIDPYKAGFPLENMRLYLDRPTPNLEDARSQLPWLEQIVGKSGHPGDQEHFANIKKALAGGSAPEALKAIRDMEKSVADLQKEQAVAAAPLPEWRRRAASGLGRAKDLTTRYFSGGGLPPEVSFENFNPQMAEDAAKFQRIQQQRHIASRIARQTQLTGSYEAARAKLEGEGVTLPPVPKIRARPAAAAAAEPGKVNIEDIVKGAANLGGEAGAKAAAKIKEITPESDKAKLEARGGGGGNGATPPSGGEDEGDQEAIPTPRRTAAAAASARQARIAQQRIQSTLTEVRARISESQSLTPVRALSVSVGQIFAQLAGRAGLQERARKASRIADFAETAASRAANEQIRLTGLIHRESELRAKGNTITEQEQKELKGLPAVIDEQLKITEQANFTRKITLRAAQKAAQIAAPTGLEIARNIGAGALGVSLGTVGFSILLQGFQLAVQEISQGIGRVNDRLTGFEQKTGELTGSLADAARASGGNVEAAVASKIALSGLGDQTAKTVQPLIDNRTAIVAGTKALEDQFDLIHAAQNIQQGQLPGGLDRALVQTTGGFPLAQIGGQRSIREIVGNEIAAAATTPAASNIVGAGRGAVAANRAPLQTPIISPSAKLNQTLDALNEDAAKAGSSMKYVSNNATAAAKTFDEISQAVQTGALPAEMQDFADTLKKAGVGIVGPNGQPVDIAGILQQFQDVAQGSIQQSRQQLLAAQQRPFRAQLQLRDVQGQFERQQLLPIQQFLAQQAQPLVPFARTPAARTPGAQQAPNFKQAQSDIAGAQTQLKGFADEGERAGLALVQDADAVNKTYGLTSNLTQQWMQTTAAVGETGRKIAQIQLSDTWQQVNYQTHQYDNELRIANRSLADAKEFLTGISQAGSDNLGLLEKQNRELDIQNTKIGFQLQALEFELRQRQINFQVAVAGFTAPGITGEERAARIEEAKKEAEIAQKQLDLQKQQFGIAKQTFGVSQQIISINAQRSVTDLIKQISLLTEGRQVTISVAIDQERLNALQKQMDAQLAQAQSVLQQAVDTRNQVYEQDAQIIATIGGDITTSFGVMIKDLEVALGVVDTSLQQYATAASQGYQPSANPGTPNYSGKNLGNTLYGATGFLGNIQGATQMVVGEAGKETVAVIRNPRELTDIPTGNGGAPTIINIQVTGNTIKSEGDMDILVRKISRSVEESLSRKTSLYGLRNPN